jgi:hypothetical protein
MSTKDRKNIVASVLAKLRNASRSSGTLFQQVLQQYAMERFLYRISKSKHAQSVVLKGALRLKTIGIPNARPTMDIDMLRTGKADQASLPHPRLLPVKSAFRSVRARSIRHRSSIDPRCKWTAVRAARDFRPRRRSPLNNLLASQLVDAERTTATKDPDVRPQAR